MVERDAAHQQIPNGMAPAEFVDGGAHGLRVLPLALREAIAGILRALCRHHALDLDQPAASFVKLGVFLGDRHWLETSIDGLAGAEHVWYRLAARGEICNRNGSSSLLCGVISMLQSFPIMVWAPR